MALFSSVQTTAPIIDVTQSKTFTLADANSRQNCFAENQRITLTIPSNASVAFPIGTSITLMLTAGRFELALAGSTELSNFSVINPKYLPAASNLELLKINTNTWSLRVIDFNPNFAIIANTHWFTSSTDTVFGLQATGGQAGVAPIGNSQTANSFFPGTIRLSTGTTATGRTWVGTTLGQIQVSRCFYTEALLSFDPLSTATESYVARVGFAADTGGINVTGAVLRYNHGLSGGQWEAICRNSAGSETIVASTITVAANTLYRLGVLLDFDGARALFFVNGTLIATITTNLPNIGVGAGCNITKLAGTTPVFIYLNQSIFYGQFLA